MAIEKLSAELKLLNGVKVEGVSRKFKITMDQAEAVGGTNEGMCPGEAFLNALGGCKCMVAKIISKSAGIKLKDLSIKMYGEIDSEGLSENSDTRPGFLSIKTSYFITADNTKEEIEQFIKRIESCCPMQDSIEKTPKMEYEVNIH